MKVLLIGSHGYVGSFLNEELRRIPGVKLYTCDNSEEAHNKADFPFSYCNLEQETVLQFEKILFFAGCSSVGEAIADPNGAIKKNVIEMYDFVAKLDKKQVFIYASSGTVYSSSTLHEEKIVQSSNEAASLGNPNNAYDASKMIFDNMAKFLDVKTIGLRMGTVCGFSPRLRKDLVFNAMNLSALEFKSIKLANPRNWRTLLFLEDLLGLVANILETNSECPKIINVGSFEITIEELALNIAQYYQVPIIEQPNTGGYSFSLNIETMREFYQPKCTDLKNEIKKFVDWRSKSDE